MDLLADTANSLWQVVLVGLLFGAGLPALFALGLRSLSVSTGADADAPTRPSPLGRIGAVLCFAVVLISILAGILMLMQDFLATSFGIHVF